MEEINRFGREANKTMTPGRQGEEEIIR